MKGIIRLRSRAVLQRLIRYKNFHDDLNANVLKSKVDRSSKEFQVRCFNNSKQKNMVVIFQLSNDISVV